MNWLKQVWVQNWPKWKPYVLKALWTVFCVFAGALLHHYGFAPHDLADKAVDHVVSETEPAEVYAMGWHNDPEEVRRIKAGLRFPVFANTPAGQLQDVPDHAYLWEASVTALGHPIPSRDQKSVGACTAFGGVNALEYLQVQNMVQALKAGQPPPIFKDLSQEALYGLGRVQVGKGALGVSRPPMYRNDGGTGAWMAEAAKQYGVVARGVYGSHDLTQYSEKTCRDFGNSGLPADIIPVAHEHLLGAISPVTTTDELKAALASGYPVTVASNVGFGQSGPYQRDQNGLLRARGTWSHQMCFIGYTTGPDRFCIINSWGPSWVSGPSGPGTPPDGTFWCEKATAQRMLNAQDSFAYSNLNGFPSKPLDWSLTRGKCHHWSDQLLTLRLIPPEACLAW